LKQETVTGLILWLRDPHT